MNPSTPTDPIEESRAPQRLYAPSRSALRPAGAPAASGASGPEPWRADYPWRPAGQEADYAADRGVSWPVRGTVMALVALANLALLSPLGVKTLIILLDVFGLVFLVETLFKVWHAARRPRVRWTTFPAFLGGRLEGVLVARPALEPIGPVRAVLRCLRDERVAEEGGAASFAPTVLYQQISEIPVPGEQLKELPLSFVLPADLPGTDLGREDATYWQVALRIPVVGPDVETVFLAPVYAPAKT